MRPEKESTGAESLLEHRWPFVLGLWAVPALLAALETYMYWTQSGKNYPFWRALLMEGPAWFSYALLTPAIFALSRRFPLQRRTMARDIGVHALASLLAGALYASSAAASALTFSPFPQRSSFTTMASRWFISALPLTTLTYFGILGAGMALLYFTEAQRRIADAARLSAQLAEARLGALRMQLHPHFLFNTLNAVTVLAKDGDAAAVARMLTLLSGLLRDVLRTDDVQLIPLSSELAFSRQYLEIELVRFADRLRISESIDQETEQALVPVFILQPLIENALRHGLAPRASGGTITLHARKADAMLELAVRDDGVGLPATWGNDDDCYGIGLTNVSARLRELYAGRATMTVVRESAGGTCASIRLPLS